MHALPKALCSTPAHGVGRVLQLVSIHTCMPKRPRAPTRHCRLSTVSVTFERTSGASWFSVFDYMYMYMHMDMYMSMYMLYNHVHVHVHVALRIPHL